MHNILVIGGSSGIGQSTVDVLSDSGHRVFYTYCENRADQVPPNVVAEQLNVLDSELDLDFLPESIHGLVYCPGSIHLKPFNRISPSSFLDDYQLQVVGFVKVVQAVLSRLKAAGDASVVSFSTVAVQQGFNFHSQVAASKGAVEGITRSLAAEFAPSIRFNAIAPSLTDTPLASKLLSSEQKRQTNADRHPLKRIGRPEDIAHMAAFLISDKSNWITGQILHVDGGISHIR